MMGFLLDLPVVFAKKKKPSTMDNMLSTTVTSFTKKREYTVVISKDYLTPNDKVLFIDDFLAYGNAALGIIDLCNFEPFHSRAEVGIVIAEEFRGKGIGQLALNLLIGHCFDYLGIHQLFAYIDVTNDPCRRLFQKCGFTECAYLKDWMRTGKTFRDVVMVQRINS